MGLEHVGCVYILLGGLQSACFWGYKILQVAGGKPVRVFSPAMGGNIRAYNRAYSPQKSRGGPSISKLVTSGYKRVHAIECFPQEFIEPYFHCYTVG